MKALFDQVSARASRITTNTYSTSFSFGIRVLHHSIRQPVYNIYGFVRYADEIVDSFHGYDQKTLLDEFREDTYKAISRGISLNPILNSFQQVVNDFNIPHDLIVSFLESMETDLERTSHTKTTYNSYIHGSAEVVGLMCLKVFTQYDENLYQRLTPYAMKLGSAFQKVNFLRDINSDYHQLGRSYFPGVEVQSINTADKKKIEEEIEEEFKIALDGIKLLPSTSGAGVYLAYLYYRSLFNKIRTKPAEKILKERIRIPNEQKVGLMLESLVRYNLKLL